MFSVLPITGLPEIVAGDDLGALLTARLAEAEPGLQSGDILVVTQKIVSKAEGRSVDLADMVPSPEAEALASEVNKDPALVELVLRESSAVVRKAPNILITRHRSGHVMANAGIDASNIGSGNGGNVLLLPLDPDASDYRPTGPSGSRRTDYANDDDCRGRCSCRCCGRCDGRGR